MYAIQVRMKHFGDEKEYNNVLSAINAAFWQ